MTDHPSQMQATDEKPWIGLAHYTSRDRAYFCGRDADVEAISRCVRRAPLTVIYGASGRGKSSFVAAGLIPDLEDHNYKVSLFRRCYDTLPDTSLAADVIATLAEAHEAAPEIRQAETLWQFVHDRRQPWCQPSLPDVPPVRPPILVFDQFEEIFTKGEDCGRMEMDAGQPRSAAQQAEDQNARKHASEFLAQLADLVENRAPESLRQSIERADPAQRQALLDQYDFKAPHVRLVLVLREDFLARLERLRDQMPALMEQRVELPALSGPQAMEAIMKPGSRRPGLPPIISEEIAARIVAAAAGMREGTAPEQIDIVPASILSLICEDLNAARKDSPCVENFSSQEVHGIIQRFYDQKLQPHPRIRHVLEKTLAPSGLRETPTLQSLLDQLSRVPDAQKQINDLQDARILVLEQRGGIMRVEFTHDKLAEIATRSWRAREATFQWRRRLRWAAAAAILAFMIAGFAWMQWTHSQRLRQMAEDARVEAEAAKSQAYAAQKKVEADFKTLIDPLTKFEKAYNTASNTQSLSDVLHSVASKFNEVKKDDPSAMQVLSTISLMQAQEKWNITSFQTLERLKEASDLKDKLIIQSPENEQFRIQKYLVLAEIGRYNKEHSERNPAGTTERMMLSKKAIAAYQEAAEGYKKDATTPTSKNWRYYANALGCIAQIHELGGDFGKALETTLERKRISEDLVANLDKANADKKELDAAQLSFATSCGVEGKYEVLLASNQPGKEQDEDFKRADAALEEDLRITERLLNEGSDIAWMQEKASVLNWQGEALRKRNDLRGAIAKYSAYRDVLRELSPNGYQYLSQYAHAVGLIADTGASFGVHNSIDDWKNIREHKVEQANTLIKLYQSSPSVTIATSAADACAQAGKMAFDLKEYSNAANDYGNAYSYALNAQNLLTADKNQEKRELLIRRVDYASWQVQAMEQTAAGNVFNDLPIYQNAVNALDELVKHDQANPPAAGAKQPVSADTLRIAFQGAQLIKVITDSRVQADTSKNTPSLISQAVIQMAKSDEAMKMLLQLPGADKNPIWQAECSLNHWFRAGLCMAQNNEVEVRQYLELAVKTIEAVKDKLIPRYASVPDQLRQALALLPPASKPKN